jgi:hypothetical protein
MGGLGNRRGWRGGTSILVVLVILGGAYAAVAAGAGQGGGEGRQSASNGKEKVGNRQAVEKSKGQGGQQTSDSDDSTDIWSTFFPWTDEPGFSANWLSGLGLALLGIFGALVTIYLFLGEFLPSMGGKAEYEALGLEIEDLSKRRDKQLSPRERFTRDGHHMTNDQRDEAAKLTADLNGIIAGKERNAQKVKRELVAIGFPLYVLLGGAFAVLLASTAPQALLIGFGWTAVVDRFGLKRELDEKSRKRDNASVKLVEAANEATATKAKLIEVEGQLSEAQQIAATATAAVATAAQQGKSAQQQVKV